MPRIRVPIGKDGRVIDPEIEAAAVAPADPVTLALIGRDMLARYRFVYDGLKGELLFDCLSWNFRCQDEIIEIFNL